MNTYEEVQKWFHLLCQYSNKDETFFKNRWQKIEKNPDIYEEIAYYMEHGDFLCKLNIQGYTVIDILIWQIDHFKSHMDRGEYDFQSNPEFMVLMAFSTLIEMTEHPASYVLAMQTETGTDYAEKY